MWLTVAFVAIVAIGIAFLLGFLLALLRERAPSTCYWVVPSRPANTRTLPEEWNHGHVADDHALSSAAGNHYVELLGKGIRENTIHTKLFASGLIS